MDPTRIAILLIALAGILTALGADRILVILLYIAAIIAEVVAA